jgi:Secretion system C-terminal sorting domain
MINNSGPYGWSNGYFWINGTGGQYINSQPGATDQLASEDFSIDGTCGTMEIFGCTDPLANNYNPAATTEDWSCDYSIDCDLNTATITVFSQAWGSEMSWNLTNEAGEIVVESNGITSWSYFEQNICLADGCYQFNMNDSWGDGWNGGYYMITVNGLLFEGSLYYGSEASDLITINSNCAEIGGCMDPASINFNSLATFDDGSCMYNNNDGFLATGLIGLEMGVNLYPNPANSGLVVNLTNLDKTSDVTISIISIDGRIITRQQIANADRSQRVEMNVESIASGLYLVQVSNGSNNATMTLVKE